MRATAPRPFVRFFLKPADSCELYDDEAALCEAPEEASVLRKRLRQAATSRRSFRAFSGAPPSSAPPPLDPAAIFPPATPAQDARPRAFFASAMPARDADPAPPARSPPPSPLAEERTARVGVFEPPAACLRAARRAPLAAAPGYYQRLNDGLEGAAPEAPPRASSRGSLLEPPPASAPASAPPKHSADPAAKKRAQRAAALANKAATGKFSRHVGVSFDARHSRWKASRGKRWCGYHDTEDDAARAVNEAAGCAVNDVGSNPPEGGSGGAKKKKGREPSEGRGAEDEARDAKARALAPNRSERPSPPRTTPNDESRSRSHSLGGACSFGSGWIRSSPALALASPPSLPPLRVRFLASPALALPDSASPLLLGSDGHPTSGRRGARVGTASAPGRHPAEKDPDETDMDDDTDEDDWSMPVGSPTPAFGAAASTRGRGGGAGEARGAGARARGGEGKGRAEA